MPDYSQGKIYKIVVKNDPNAKMYIGSTVKTLKDRWYSHTSDAYNPKHTIHCCSKQMFDDYGIDNCTYELIEEYPCKTREELLARETHHMKQIGFNRLYNKHKSLTTVEEWKEYQHAWYLSNQERIVKREREKWNENKDVLNALRRQKYECKCGIIINKSSKPRHEQSQGHLDWLAKQAQPVSNSLPKPKLNLKLTLKK